MKQSGVFGLGLIKRIRIDRIRRRTLKQDKGVIQVGYIDITLTPELCNIFERFLYEFSDSGAGYNIWWDRKG
jgi:hypothetical protein